MKFQGLHSVRVSSSDIAFTFLLESIVKEQDQGDTYERKFSVVRKKIGEQWQTQIFKQKILPHILFQIFSLSLCKV